MKGDRYLLVSDVSGLAIIDVEESKIVAKYNSAKDTVNLIKLDALNDLNRNALVSLSKTGMFRIWKEGDLEQRFIEIIKPAKCHSGMEISAAI